MTKSTTHLKEVLSKVEDILKPILSPRQPFDVIETSFLTLSREERCFALHWIDVVALSNIELAYTLAVQISEAQSLLSVKAVRLWLLECLSVYDREGLYPAVVILKDIQGFKFRQAQQVFTCQLKDVKPHLDIFIRGLAGRALTLKPGEESYTDTKHLYLPDTISRYRDLEKNKTLYKALACFLWAQTWYGTFRQKAYSSLSTRARLENYADPDMAKRYFLALENVRLLANIERDLPGLHREMSALSPLILPKDASWKVISKKLSLKGASVEETFEALDRLMQLNISLSETDYIGGLNLNEVETQIEERKSKAIDDISALLKNKTIDQVQLQQTAEAFNSAEQGTDEATEETSGDGDSKDNEQLAPSKEESSLSELIHSLLQDVEYLEDDVFDDILKNQNDKDKPEAKIRSGDSDSLEKEHLALDEWDYLRQSYRSRWCQVSITRVEAIESSFAQQTKDKYPFLLSQIRKLFEAMRDQPRHANRQTDGDDIDLDAVVDMYTAKLAGEELSERVYIRRQQNERSVSVCLLVDMSGSTKGWINLAMRESLILFSEALNTLGDQYAILGFSGLTRQRCEIYTVKEFSDTQMQETSKRISNIQAKDYTRMGFAVRYATQYLQKSDAKHRILLMLSDGKPDDYDGYQGEYGIQDTRKAILEAQGHSISPFSITIDKQAQIYLPRLFGPGQYMILNDVSMLPLKLTEVYKNLSN